MTWNTAAARREAGLRIAIGLRVCGVVLSVAFCAAQGAEPAARGPEPPALTWFFEAAGRDDNVADKALDNIARRWRDGYTAMIVDLARFMRSAPRRDTLSSRIASGRESREQEDQPSAVGLDTEPDLSQPPDPSSIVRVRLIRFLEKQTGQRFGDDLGRWRAWMWQLLYEPHPDYAAFEGTL